MFNSRMKPHFIIIGGVKCASTSLFRYLIEHPNVLPGSYKEPGFFNNRSWLRAGLRFHKYLNNFPRKSSKETSILNWPTLSPEGKIVETKLEQKRDINRKYVTGEASATYNFSANPRLVKFFLPRVKIIVLLRNPTYRFISHWKMFRRFTEEGRPGYDVGDLVPFIKHEITAYHDNEPTRLIHQGLYHDIVQKWQHHFDENQFLILESQEFSEPDGAAELMNTVTTFLELPEFDYSEIVAEKFNVAPKEENNDEAKKLLDQFYQTSNEQLKLKLGIEFQ